jgi:hypothetical protein
MIFEPSIEVRSHLRSARAVGLTVAYSVTLLVATNAIRRLILASTLSGHQAELVGATALSVAATVLLPPGRDFLLTERARLWRSWRAYATVAIILLGSLVADVGLGDKVLIARAVVVAANEEFVFRVLLANRVFAVWCGVSRPVAWAIAAVASAVTFGLAHVPDLRECEHFCTPRTPTIVVAGLLLSLVRLVAGVGAAIGTHTIFNTVVYSGNYLQQPVNRLSTILVTGLVGVACGVAINAWCERKRNGSSRHFGGLE